MSNRLDRRQYRDAQFRIRRMFGLTAALIGAIGAATTSMTAPVQAETSVFFGQRLEHVGARRAAAELSGSWSAGGAFAPPFKSRLTVRLRGANPNSYPLRVYG